MTLTLEPELESAISKKAAEQGQDADSYLRHLIVVALNQPMPTIIRSTLTPEERRRFQQVKSCACGRPQPARLDLRFSA